MPNQEWEQVKAALQKPATPEAQKEAAEAFRRYEIVQLQKGRKRSKPTLVSLGYKKTYPHSIPLQNIPDQIQRDPEFFKLMGRIVNKGSK